MKSFTFVIVLLFLIPTIAFTTEWTADKSHSNVNFSIRHMVISEVTGKFQEFDITVNSSKDDFTDGVIIAAINVNSINTGVERRDNHLRSDDFFNAEKFPEMKFTSTSFEKVGDNQYKITGELTIRDITKTVTFDAVILGGLNDPRMGTRVGWKATTAINRFDYGLKWNRTIETGGLIAGDTVKITINLELVKQPEPKKS